MNKKFLLILTLSFFSCSINKFVIRQTGAILDYSVLALYEESDLTLAEQALPSNIILLEGMVKGDSENVKILLTTTQALAGYAMGFVEDEEPARAKRLYLRARDYGLMALRQNKEFLHAENKTLDEFEIAVQKMKKRDIDALFWTAFSWAGWINLNLTDPQVFIDLPKVQLMMKRVLQLDESYFYGAAHLFFGSILGSKPRMMGGDPEKARQHFEKNLELTKGKFLLTYVYYAKYYAAKVLDEQLYNQLLDKIDSAAVEILAGGELFNAIAKKKANILREKSTDIF